MTEVGSHEKSGRWVHHQELIDRACNTLMWLGWETVRPRTALGLWSSAIAESPGNTREEGAGAWGISSAAGENSGLNMSVNISMTWDLQVDTAVEGGCLEKKLTRKTLKYLPCAKRTVNLFLSTYLSFPQYQPLPVSN